MRLPSYALALALALPSFTALPAAAHPGHTKPAAAASAVVVRRLYERWLADAKAGGGDPVKAVAPLLTPELHQLLKRAYDGGDADGAIIEWDPFTASQEGTERFVVGRATRHKGHDLVPVSLWGTDQKQPHGVVLRVVAGRVDDVAVHDQKFPVPSLKKWLKNALAAAKKK